VRGLIQSSIGLGARAERSGNSAWTIATASPFIRSSVRIACRVCTRSGSYRLARLAAKYGPEISLQDLLERFSYDCLWWAEARSKRGQSACGVYLPDLEQLRPPDAPPGLVKLRLVKKE
jgi:hypothetical protein